MKKFKRLVSVSIAIAAFSFGLSDANASLASALQTFRAARAGKALIPEILPTVEKRWVERFPCPYSERDIPASLRSLRDAERVNARFQEEEVFGSPIDMKVLGPYDPAISGVEYAPYIPMPKSEFAEYLVADSISPNLKKALFFKGKDGVEYARYFIHPTKTASYQSLIDRYGIVRDEFVGFFSASPRSMYVWHPKDESITPFVAKTSLHFVIDGSVRTNPPQKAARSSLVNSIFASIPKDTKEELGFDFMPESVQLLPEGRATATIYREIPAHLLAPEPGGRWVPGFYLSSQVDRDGTSMLKRLVGGDADPLRSASELLRPLIRITAYLMFTEGLKGELHEQNVLFELDRAGRPTGRVDIKDLDGFRVDTELRVRQGLPMDGLRKIFKPFVYSKFTKASGWGGGGFGFDQEAYEVFIKHTFGYSFCKVLDCSKAQKVDFYRHMDRIMSEEAAAVTGLRVNPNMLSANEASVSRGLEDVAERFRRNLNEGVYYEHADEAINYPVKSLRKLSPAEEIHYYRDARVRRVLREEFIRLRKKGRASSLLGDLNARETYFLFHGDLIEARAIDPITFAEKPIGFAAPYDVNHPQSVAFQTRLNGYFNAARVGLPGKKAVELGVARARPRPKLALVAPRRFMK